MTGTPQAGAHLTGGRPDNVIRMPRRVQCYWGLAGGERCPNQAKPGHSHCKRHLAMLPDTTKWPDGLDPDALRAGADGIRQL